METDLCNDWSATWTVEEFQTTYPNVVFTFRGPGWYVVGTDYLCVQDIGDPNGRYLFIVWYERDPRPAMLKACMSLPEYSVS